MTRLKYIVLSENKGAGPHHVLIERYGVGWLQKCAVFSLFDRAEGYAYVENDMASDGDLNPSEQNDEAPTDAAPSSRLPELVRLAGGAERRETEALIDGFRLGRRHDSASLPPAPPAPAAEPRLSSVNSIDVSVVEGDQGQKTISIVPVKPPSPTVVRPSPVVSTPVQRPPVARGRWEGHESKTQSAIEAIEKSVMADLPALMIEFPAGPSTTDLFLKYKSNTNVVGGALRNLADRGLLRYERNKDGPTKYVRPLDYAVPPRDDATLTTIQEDVLRAFKDCVIRDGLPSISKNEMARRAGISIGTIEAALDALTNKGRLVREGLSNSPIYRLAGATRPPIAVSIPEPAIPPAPIAEMPSNLKLPTAPTAEIIRPRVVETVTPGASPIEELFDVIRGALPDLIKEFPFGPTIDELHKRFGGKRADLETAIVTLNRQNQIDFSRLRGITSIIPYGYSPKIGDRMVPVDTSFGVPKKGRSALDKRNSGDADETELEVIGAEETLSKDFDAED